MKYGKLRIAFSITCGIVCLLLIAVWVRSYFHEDVLRGIAPAPGVEMSSNCGRFTILHVVGAIPPGTLFYTGPARTDELRGVGERRILGFMWERQDFYTRVGIPYWFIGLTIAGIASTPWIPWRFSLRTMLMVMTLIAVGLGLIVMTLGAAF
jgi:hypothetical protein